MSKKVMNIFHKKKLLIPLVLAILLFGSLGLLLGVVLTGKTLELNSVDRIGINDLKKGPSGSQKIIFDHKLELANIENQLGIERKKVFELQNKMEIELTRILFENPNYKNFERKIDGSLEEGIKAYLSADYVKSYDIMLPHAINGITRAQFYLGALYFKGRSLLRNRIQSYLWLDLASKSSYPGARQLLDRLQTEMSSEELLDVVERSKQRNHTPNW